MILSAMASPLAAADSRMPIPDQAKQAEAQKLVRGLFKPDYARTSADDKAALGVKLLQHASETKDDPAARFVLLREARDLAAQGGDLRTAFGAIGLLVADSAVDGDENPAVLPKLEPAARTPD